METIRTLLLLALVLGADYAQADGVTALMDGQEVSGSCPTSQYLQVGSYTVPEGDVVEFDNIGLQRINNSTYQQDMQNGELWYTDGSITLQITQDNIERYISLSNVSFVSEPVYTYNIVCGGSPGSYRLRTYKPVGIGMLQVDVLPKKAGVYVKMFDKSGRLSAFGVTDANGVLAKKVAYGKYTVVASDMDNGEGSIVWHNQSPMEKATAIKVDKPIGTPKKVVFSLGNVTPVISGVSYSSNSAGASVTIIGSGFGKKRGLVEFDGGVFGKIVSWSDTSITVTRNGGGASAPCPRVWSKEGGGWSQGYSDPLNCTN